MKTNKIKKIALNVILVLGCSISLQAMAATPEQGKTPELQVPKFSASQLQQAGCDPNIMNTMIQTYINERTYDRAIESKIQVYDQNFGAAPPPKAGGGAGGSGFAATSCVQGAISQINGVTTMLNALAGGLGSFNIQSLIQNVQGQLVQAACTQVNNYTNQLVSGITGNISGAVSGVTSTLNNGVSAGGINVGLQQGQSGTPQQGSVIPQLTGLR